MADSPRRPVFLNLFLIRLPVPGIMSIIHRVTGVLMVLLIPVSVWLLEYSLTGSEGFDRVRGLFEGNLARLVLFLLLWGLIHHLLAGIRYLLIDIDIGVERPMFRVSAWLVLLLSPLAALITVWGGV